MKRRESALALINLEGKIMLDDSTTVDNKYLQYVAAKARKNGFHLMHRRGGKYWLMFEEPMDLEAVDWFLSPSCHEEEEGDICLSWAGQYVREINDAKAEAGSVFRPETGMLRQFIHGEAEAI
jgi:hypothetical protein